MTDCMTYLIREAETDDNSIDYSASFPKDISQVVNVDLLEPTSQRVSWRPFEWRTIECPLDVYSITCFDEFDQTHVVSTQGKVLASNSARCAGFLYNVDKSARYVETPLISTFDNPYMGTYSFQVRGGNSRFPFPQSMSDIYEF